MVTAQKFVSWLISVSKYRMCTSRVKKEVIYVSYNTEYSHDVLPITLHFLYASSLLSA